MYPKKQHSTTNSTFFFTLSNLHGLSLSYVFLSLKKELIVYSSVLFVCPLYHPKRIIIQRQTMAACGSLSNIFEKPWLEIPTLRQSLSPWKHLNSLEERTSQFSQSKNQSWRKLRIGRLPIGRRWPSRWRTEAMADWPSASTDDRNRDLGLGVCRLVRSSGSERVRDLRDRERQRVK